MDPSLDEGREHGRVAGRARDQDPRVREQAPLQKVYRVGQGRSAAHALVVPVQDEQHAILHQVERAPHLGDGVADGCRPRE